MPQEYHFFAAIDGYSFEISFFDIFFAKLLNKTKTITYVS